MREDNALSLEDLSKVRGGINISAGAIFTGEFFARSDDGSFNGSAGTILVL